MKKSPRILFFSFLLIAFTTQLSAQEKNWYPKGHQAKKWFKQKTWLSSLNLNAHKSIDRTEFARQYHLNRSYWEKAFQFLREHDLQTIKPGKYPIDGDNVFVSVTADSSKDFDKTKWESHKKYIDLQLIAVGEERMGVYPVDKSTVTKPYDEKRDVANYDAKGKFYNASDGTFFIFFPMDAHRPNITPGGNKVVKKVVIKIRWAEEL